MTAKRWEKKARRFMDLLGRSNDRGSIQLFTSPKLRWDATRHYSVNRPLFTVRARPVHLVFFTNINCNTISRPFCIADTRTSLVHFSDNGSWKDHMYDIVCYHMNWGRVVVIHHWLIYSNCTTVWIVQLAWKMTTAGGLLYVLHYYSVN